MATTKKIASHLTGIPDHLLAEIFLRLPAADDLARTSAACVSFRRLVTDRSFLRRFRRLHAPPLIGFLDPDGFSLALPPHTSASGARAVEHVADFSFSFLPSHCRWTVRDMRDGHVLLDGRPAAQDRPASMQLVVCDPLHSRYILLPLVPDDLIASGQHSVPRPQCKPFLLPLGEEETTFRVICMFHCKINLSAFIFSSSTGQWTAAASKALDDLVRGKGEPDVISEISPFFLRGHYAYGCFYWDGLVIDSMKLLVLDIRRMEFSMADVPPGDWKTRGLAIVEAGEGRLGMFGFHRGTASDLSYTIARNKGESPSQCQMEKTISLDSGYSYFIKSATERYLLLGRTDALCLENPLTEYFSMDIKTLKLQRVCGRQGTHIRHIYSTHIYTNFPPSLLSSPTI